MNDSLIYAKIQPVIQSLPPMSLCTSVHNMEPHWVFNYNIDIHLHESICVKDCHQISYEITLEYINTNYSDHFQVFTGGSKKESYATSSFYIPELKIGKKFRISDNTSVLNAELYAILQVLTWLEDNPPKLLVIFSDSLSALHSIESLNNQNNIVLEIRRYLRFYEINNINISIVWIPGHIGLKGNEMADKLAKQGLGSSEVDKHVPLQINDYINLLEKFILEKWQTRYNKSKIGSFYKLLIPNVSSKVKYSDYNNRRKEVSLTRIRFGHCLLNNVKYLFGLVPSRNCDICHVEEDVNHFIIHCINYSNQRSKLINKAVEKNIHLNIHDLLRDMDMYNLIWDYLIKSKKIL